MVPHGLFRDSARRRITSYRLLSSTFNYLKVDSPLVISQEMFVFSEGGGLPKKFKINFLFQYGVWKFLRIPYAIYQLEEPPIAHPYSRLEFCIPLVQIWKLPFARKPGVEAEILFGDNLAGSTLEMGPIMGITSLLKVTRFRKSKKSSTRSPFDKLTSTKVNIVCMFVCVFLREKEDLKVRAALARSHMSGSISFDRTMEQTTEKIPLAPKQTNCYTMRQKKVTSLQELLH